VTAFWQELEPLAQTAHEPEASEADEATVITVRVGQSRPVGSADRPVTASSVRLEVPLERPLAEPPKVSDHVVPAASESRSDADRKKLTEFTTQRWTRRLFTTGLAASFIATSFWVHSIVSGVKPRRGVVTGNLNLRAKPAPSSPSLGWIPKNYPVKIVGSSQDGQWYEVEATYWDFNGQVYRSGRGWVSRFYVNLEEEPGR
jgi:hypothetical protein